MKTRNVEKWKCLSASVLAVISAILLGMVARADYRSHADLALEALYGKDEEAWYLIEPEFEGYDEWMDDAHLLQVSYETEDVHMKNVAFSYDNALVAMAFIAEDTQFAAANILDSFVYASEHDRYLPGRVRNAYAAGNINAFPYAEKQAARLPGWYDDDLAQWCEDRYQVGCNVGNTSYVVLAMLQYDAAYQEERYLETAKTLMDWVLENCTDGGDGFTGGYDGWPEADPPVVYPFTYKSIEHNIDAYAAFRQLYAVTGEEKYREAAERALRFIDSMYDPERGLFWSGTGDDGVTPSKENVVLDAQVWAALALGEQYAPYEAALETAESMHQTEGGYAFCQSNENGGWWPEGTAFTALLYREYAQQARAAGDEALSSAYEMKADAALDALCAVQDAYGLFPAATTKNLSTGLYQFDGSPLTYADDLHIAPTAWFILAVDGFNPYVF
ncbi:MAG: hypothetical protein IJI24_04190 [Lachnospiraceae bacterium]|nr:hypothetical protein [Lachnospiraceae bacterium]